MLGIVDCSVFIGAVPVLTLLRRPGALAGATTREGRGPRWRRRRAGAMRVLQALGAQCAPLQAAGRRSDRG